MTKSKAAKVQQNATFARISFFTFGEPPPRNRINVYDGYYVPGVTRGGAYSSLVGFEFVKNLGQPAGQLSLTLKGHKAAGNGAFAGKPWPELIEEGDWWGIDIVKNGVRQGLSFGRIDSVSVDIQAGMGEGAVVVNIKGRDVGYALQDTPVFFDPHNPVLDNALGIQMMTIIDRAVGKPHEVIGNVIKGFLGGLGAQPFAGHHHIPGGVSEGTPIDESGAIRWVDGVDFDSCMQDDLRGKLLAQSMFTPSPQPIWSFVQSWLNPVMNELYIDAVPTPGYPKKACLTMREKPFVNSSDKGESPWFSLRQWRIESSLIKSINLSRGANRINYVSLSGEMLVGINEESMVSTFLTVTNKDSAVRYGLRRLEEYTRYMDETKNTGAQVEHNDWLNLIVSWNVLNHEHWSGQIVLGEMRSEIRVGDKIALINGPPAHYEAFPADEGEPAGAITFYVEGVKHRYMTGEQPIAETTLLLSRGHPEPARVPDVVEEVAKWENLLQQGKGSANDQNSLNNTTEAEAEAIDGYDSQGDTLIVETNQGD